MRRAAKQVDDFDWLDDIEAGDGGTGATIVGPVTHRRIRG